MSDTPPTPLSRNDRLRNVLENRPLLLALGVAVAGLCLLLIFMVLLLRGGTGLSGVGGPTPFPSPVANGIGDVIVAGVSGSGTVSLTVNAPTAMRVGSQNFSVRSEAVQADGTWDPDVGEGNTAVWVYGTLINYILGLPDNQENRSLLESLAPGDEIVLVLRDGFELRFAVTNRELIAANRSDVFAQSSPGLTLVMLRARGDERLVVQAAFVADTAVVSGIGAPSDGGVVEIGEPAQLGNLRLTIENAVAHYDNPEAPPGFIFYTIDFLLENVGAEAIDLARLRFVLSDDPGNQYANSVQAARYGAYAPVAGVTLPGERRQASAGYQIPAGLVSASLTWSVMREGGTNQIRALLPFTETGSNGIVGVEVSLQAASVSADGTSLILGGQINNNGSQPLVVNETNVSLRSDGTVHLMLSTNPAFPWVVPPGQSQPFSVSFQRPGETQAVFSLLNQPFELTGLR